MYALPPTPCSALFEFFFFLFPFLLLSSAVPNCLFNAYLGSELLLRDSTVSLRVAPFFLLLSSDGLIVV